MAGVSLKNIYKTYSDGFNAVNDFNLDIGDNEFVVLVGPSGCGKSTTLRMIAGLEEISKGEIYIDNVCINNMEPKDRDIAMVFQNYALYPHMNVFDNMAFGLKLKKMSKKEIEKKVLEVAKILDIQDNLKRKPRELSGGQRQRVAIGRAMVRSPKVFLMDEPLSNLDAKLRVQMRIEIAKLYKQLQTTFIYVTHDQVEAMTLGTRIVVMNKGIIQQVDKPTDIYNNPSNMFVAGFIGSPQMNFIDAIVRLDKESNEVFVNCAGVKIHINNKMQDKFREYIDKEIVIGARPECIKLTKEKEGNSIECLVEMVENMGSEKYIHLSLQNKSIVIRYFGEDTINIGEKVNVIFKDKSINFFDRKTEKAI